MILSDGPALSDALLHDLRSVPDGEKISQCLQCGTCTASCPTSVRMDFSPRAVIAALRAGMLDHVIASNTVWMCASCYSCTVRCPAGIPLTDVMYRIKQLGVARGLVNDRARGVAMARAFVEVVERFGRNSEGELLRRYYGRTGRARALSQIPLGMRLLRRGRLGVRPRKISGIQQLRAMMAAMQKVGSA
jgi:heterodisulfide reductase subunit C2